MSQLKVNSIVPVGGLPSGANGGILQVVQAVKTDTFSHNSTSFADITGLSAAITPSSNSSKIFCDARIYYSVGVGSGTITIKTNFVRGSTNIGQPSGSTTHESTMMSWGSNAYMQTRTMNFLDSPATTSATTYKVQLAGDNTAATIYVNRYYNSDTYHAISTLTLYEVTA
tara:strand:- start:529 stop:1038 length:510 start_codon:yes stop_codon:yes gene_type:complete